VLLVFIVKVNFEQVYFIISDSADLVLLSLLENYLIQVVITFVVYPFY